jgi:hypothetical protein
MGLALLCVGSLLVSSQTYSVPIIPDVFIFVAMLFFTVESISFLRAENIEFPMRKNA